MLSSTLYLRGADVTGDSYSLYWACNNGHLEVVKFLVSEGADINEALCFATIGGHKEIVEYLVSQGAIIP